MDSNNNNKDNYIHVNKVIITLIIILVIIIVMIMIIIWISIWMRVYTCHILSLSISSLVGLRQ